MSDVSAGRLHLDAVADTSGFAADAKRRIDAEVKAIRAKIKVELDTRGLVKQAREAAKTAGAAATVRIKAEIDSRGLVASARQAARSASESATVRFKTTLDPAGLKGAARAAAKAAGANIKIGLDFDEAAFEARLAAAIARLDGRYSINVNVNADTTGASAHMAAWRAAQSSNGVSIPFSLNLGGGGGIGALGQMLSKLKLPAIIALAPIAASALSAVAGALTAIVGSAAQASVGLAALPGLMGALVMAGGTLIGAFSGIGDAVGEMGEADAGAAQQAVKAADQRVDAARAVEDAQERLRDAYKAAQDQEHAAEDAQRQARYSLMDAVWALQESEEDALAATKATNEAREQARKNIDGMRESLERLNLSEEKATNNLAKAKAALQDLMWDASATPQEILDAQLDVSTASQDVEDVRDQQAELSDELAETGKVGVDGSDAVKSAREAESDATHALMLAERNLAEARHSQADTAAANADAAVAAAEAIADAQQGIKDAQQASVAMTQDQSFALAEQKTAYDKLSPAGQRFADFIYNTMRPRVRALRDALQGAVLPPVQRGITAAMPFFDTLQAGLVDTGGVVGDFVEQLGGLVGSKGFNENSTKIMDSNNRALGYFGQTILNLTKWLQDITVVAGPTLIEPFARWTEALTGTWVEMARTGRETGTMRKRFIKARETIGLLKDIVVNLGESLHNITGAAVPAGDSMLQSFEGATQAFADWTGSLEGETAIKGWVDSSVDALASFGRVMGSMGAFFGAILNPELFGTFMETIEALTPTLTRVFDIIQTALSPVIDALGDAFVELGPQIEELFVALAPLLKGLGAVLGEVVRQSATAIGAVLRILTPVIAVISNIVGPLLTRFRKPIAFLLLSFANLGGILMKVGGVAGKVIGGIIVLAQKMLRPFVKFGRFLAGVFLGAFDPIVDAAEWVWDVLFGHSIFPDIQAALGRFMGWVRGLMATARAVFQPLIDAAMFVWHHGIEPAFNGIVAAGRALASGIGWVFNKIVGAARLWWRGVGLYFRVLRAAVIGLARPFIWLYGRISWAFGKIKAAARLWWSGVKVYFNALRKGLTKIGEGASWLWGKIRDAFNNIRSGISVAYNRFIRPVFERFVTGLRHIGEWATDLYRDHIKPAWDNIKSKIVGVWDHGVKPVFDKMVKFVKTTIPSAFDTMKRKVGEAWDKLKEIAASPIRWVVDHVYNDGIRKVVNAIPGVDDLDEVNLNFARGGTFAGTLPGYSPGRDNYSFASTDGKGINLGLGGGESIMRPEWTRQVGPRAVAMMNSAARRGGDALKSLLGGNDGNGRGNKPRFANGGVFGKTLNYFLGGVMPLQAGALTNNHGLPYYGATFAGDLNGPLDLATPHAKVMAWKAGTVAHMNYGNDHHGRYGNHAIINHPQGGSSLYAHMQSMLGSLIGKTVAAGQMIGRVGDTGNAQGVHLHFETRGSVPIEGGVGGSGGGGNTGFTPGEQKKIDKGKKDEGSWKDAIKAVKNTLTSLPGRLNDVREKFGVWGGYMKDMGRSALSDMQQWINDKIPNEIKIPGPNIPLPDNPINIFDKGGDWLGGLGANLSGKTETVFTNENMVDMSTNLASIALGLRGQVTSATNNTTSGNSGLTIERIEVSAPPEKVADVLDELRHKLQVLALGGVHARGTLGGPV